ncbi:DUF805 domain-containing protein [bacterium]|nr:DUF805 domain-containing protein [bacterium]
MSASKENDASSYIPEAGLLSVAKHFLSFTRKAGLLEVWTVGLFSFVIFAVSQLAKSDPTQFFPSSLSSRPSQVYIPGISDVSVTFPLFVLNFLISLALITRRLRTLTWSLWWLLPVVLVPYYSTLFVALLFFLPTTAELKASSLLNLISNNNSSDNVDTRIASPDIGEEISEKENNTKVIKKTNNTNAAQSTLSEKSTNEPQVKIDPPIVENQDEKQLTNLNIEKEVQEAPWNYPATLVDIEADKSGSNMKKFIEANSSIFKAKRLNARCLHDGSKWVVVIMSPLGQKTFQLGQIAELTQWVNECK